MSVIIGGKEAGEYDGEMSVNIGVKEAGEYDNRV